MLCFLIYTLWTSHFLFVEFFLKCFPCFLRKTHIFAWCGWRFRSERTTTTVVSVGHKWLLISRSRSSNTQLTTWLSRLMDCVCVFYWAFWSCFWPYMSESRSPASRPRAPGNDPIKLKSTVIFIAILYTNNPKRHSFV